MNIYGPGDGIPRGGIGPNEKPYVSKRLRDDGIDIRWVEDNTKLFKGYWQFYNKTKKNKK